MILRRLLATAAVALAAASALLLPALGPDAPVRVTFEDGSDCAPTMRCWDAVQAGTFYAPEVTR